MGTKRTCLTLCLLLAAQSLPAQEPASQPLPTPKWVEMFDQGESDAALAGLKTPRGIKLEVVAQKLPIASAAEVAFDEQGRLHVLEWTPSPLRFEWANFEWQKGPKFLLPSSVKEAPDKLLRLDDADGDGVYESVQTIWADLEIPSGLLFEGGWTYWTSRGRLLRRRPHDAELLKQLLAATEAKQAPPTKLSGDGQWIEQQLVGGLRSLHPFHVNRPMLGADGWLYLACSTTSLGESWDGSRGIVQGSGSILRMRPDGSRLHEFARGLCRPAGVASDSLHNLFVADRNWNADGTDGLRLIHILEGGDYGWQHDNGKPTAEELVAAHGRPDRLRAAVTRGRPGTLAAFHETDGNSTPEAVHWLGSASFPEFCRNLLVVADFTHHRVRAYGLESSGPTFRLKSQFDLLASAEPSFCPTAIAVGPDGGLYVADERDGKAIRIYRLSWSGTATAPAIALAPRDSWSKLPKATDDELLALLESSSGEMQRRAIGQLVARGKSAGALNLLANEGKPVQARAAALCVVRQLPAEAGRETLVKLLTGKETDLVRLAAEALGDSPPTKDEEFQELAESLEGAASYTADPAKQRPLMLALGKLAAAAKSIDIAERNFEGTSVTHGPKMSPYVFDAHVRALEMTPGAAKELMLGNLDVALNMPEADPVERQRIKQFVVLTAEAMRTRELTEFLDALLRGEENLFVRLEAPLAARLLACYRNLRTVQPIPANAVAEWIEKNPGSPPEVEIAALETMSLVTVSKRASIDNLADKLLANRGTAISLADSLLAGRLDRLDRSLLLKIKAALASHAMKDKTGTVAEVLKKLPQ